MSVYLDASVVVSFFVNDPLSHRADRFMGSFEAGIFSDFGAAEFASAIARRVRSRLLTPDDARATLADFDSWTVRAVGRVDTTSADIAAAAAYLRRLDLNLRTPDAVHLAIAQRLDAEVATFDERMASCAQALGVRVASLQS